MNTKPRKSLRTLLMLWFLFFSVVPLAFITGYSLVKYEQAINQELIQRLKGNQREIQVIVSEFENFLSNKSQQRLENKSLVYHLSRNNLQPVRDLAADWLRNSISELFLIYNRDGRLDVALFKDKNGMIQRNEKYEGTDRYLGDKFMEKARTDDFQALIDVNKNGRYLDLLTFTTVRAKNGNIVGFIEETIRLDNQFFTNLKKRLNIEIFLFTKNSEKIVASHEDLALYKPNFFLDEVKRDSKGMFDLTIQEVPFGFIMSSQKWGEERLFVGIGASKGAIRAVLANVNVAFFTVVAVIVILLIGLSVIISQRLLKPLSDLVEAIQKINPDDEKTLDQLPSAGDTELGLLTESFNELFKRVRSAQLEKKGKIDLLEQANLEIRDTQSKLVHTAKMASLGQLVAGIAHELNNPIGFIYSNMGHLKDYSEKLIGLVKAAEEKSKVDLSKEKSEAEFDYIVEDMPKLINSCQDGARRTRDIVLGLRNFSRLEEAKEKEIDLNEALENTLQLLTGELKNRIEVKKSLGKLPEVTCYPSQLNQVFMNILSNAAQAIEGKGEISIQTKKLGNSRVEIRIKDNGKGMDKDTIQKIYDPFFTTKVVGQGTGLGLSISYGIIEKHKGEITVNSNPGEGTEFIIVLPIKGPKS